MAITKNYGLVKPAIGGSENEWGGNLNDDLDKLDALLGGDSPINGIKISSGDINGEAISGPIGGVNSDVEIHPDVEISGKVNRLVGLNSPDGTITNVDINCRQLEVEGGIREGQAPVTQSTNATMAADLGSIHAAEITTASTYTYNLNMPLIGQRIKLMVNKRTTDVTNIVWQWNNVNSAIQWIGGQPELTIGINAIDFWTANAGNGIQLFGSYDGVVS